jgi:hypothetical protein
MPDEAELRLLAPAPAAKPCIAVGGRGMGIVRALLATEVRLAILSRARRLRALNRSMPWL